jgi:hypothetical protein
MQFSNLYRTLENTFGPVEHPTYRHMKTDYGCDPLGDGKFKMVPSGDIVDKEERDKRLKQKPAPKNDIFGMPWEELEQKQGGKLNKKGL